MLYLFQLGGLWLFSVLFICASGWSNVESLNKIDLKAANFITHQIDSNDDETCPPCFNCMLPMFECKQFSRCNEYNGQCECIEGFGGADCSVPQCGSLSGPGSFVVEDNSNSNRPLRNDTESTTCRCDDGWTGINCNLCEVDSVCNKFMPDDSIEGTCNSNGMIVNRLYSNCNVVNNKILKILNGKVPQITFICDSNDQNCNFQFWIDQIESFYCDLNDCQFDIDLQSNQTTYQCNNIKCKCVPGTMLCGKGGSVDISDFLTEEIQGPGKFQCNIDVKHSIEHECKFEEPKMNELISTIFGDDFIQLSCNSTECLHYSQVPGHLPPDSRHGQKRLSWTFNLLLLSIISLLGFSSYYIIFSISKSPFFTNVTNSSIQLPNGQYDFLKNDISATLSFQGVSYSINNKNNDKNNNSTDDNIQDNQKIDILQNILGIVKPGEIMAIMGGSGAGKTTLLDVLAMKDKPDGTVLGDIKINGKELQKSYLRKFIGFVDQDDYLLPTLTVYETVLNSALLRLPKSMSFAAKQLRVLQILDELRILEIKDRLIGNDFQRGISGGEKRRVSIACELVTSPSILILDEPTSGLDSNNANNVINCLERMAKHHNRTLILSIHQPRSNIFHLFNKLVLLSNGKLIYSGEASNVTKFLESNQLFCPAGYNIADYLIDITFNDVDSNSDFRRENAGVNYQEENGQTMSEFVNKTDLLSINFQKSSHFEQVIKDINNSIEYDNNNNIELPKLNETASFDEQLLILCSRTFKNVYRNPKLLIENYLLTILLGLFLGTLYYDISVDISGFQNRMGLFFFILTYFGFITFTGLSSFAQERIIFIKERSNNYYTPLAYYISKIISDVLPLRVFPPIFISLIVYPLAGLNMVDSYENFVKFILILILFNLGISLEILTVGIIFDDLNNSIILSVLLLLGSILFSGLFINTEQITNVAFKYLKSISIFYYAYEALLINEVKSLVLKERKFGLDIEVPGATILSTFGFKVRNLLFDINILILFNIVFLVVGYFALKYLVIEKR